MKISLKTAENHLTAAIKFLPMMMFCFLLLFSSIICLFYSPKIVYSSSFSYNRRESSSSSMDSGDSVLDPSPESPSPTPREETNLSHVVFGIAASAKLWNHRKNYIKLWWRSDEMRGIVWLDEPVETADDDHLLPPVRISGDTSEFVYRNPEGNRSGIRISRIVSETLRLGIFDLAEIRWLVMGDDDTFFAVDNLVKVLRKYDHRQFYYIGSSSESHLQNMHFSYDMAYGGGGFAISYPLAKELEKMQDNCLRRYPKLYGSDDRIQACMAELGVPLTREPGFHQCDVYGNLFGLLTAHPLAPFVSLHHLDIVDPIFPEMGRFQALQKLGPPMKLDSYGLMQQSICYDKSRLWTVSIAWGYVVQIFLTTLFPKDVQLPATTFLNWYPNAGSAAHAFNTRPFSLDACQNPFLYYFHDITFDASTNRTVSGYTHYRIPEPECRWKMSDPSTIKRVEVLKKPDPLLWDKAPRRQCCRILATDKQDEMLVDIGECEEDEIIGRRFTASPPSSGHPSSFQATVTVLHSLNSKSKSQPLSLSIYKHRNFISSMNRRIIPFLSADPQTESESESESSLSPTAMGYPVGYADVFFPNTFLHLLFFLGYIRSLIVSLFRFLGLSDFLESGVVWPENPTSIFDVRSVSPFLIEEFFPVVKFSDIYAVAVAGFPPECCAVCLCEFQDDEEVRFLKNCKHIFHKECLDRWMIRDQRSCPLCRALIVPEESIPPLVDFSGCSEFSGDYS